MKVEGGMFLILFVFFGICSIVYGILSQEWSGTALFAFAAGLGLLVSFYVLFTGRRIGTRHEDDPDAEVADAAGEVGFFSPHSWWPLGLALGGAIITFGLVFGWWIVSFGVIVLAIALYGLLFEYYRGQRV